MVQSDRSVPNQKEKIMDLAKPAEVLEYKKFEVDGFRSIENPPEVGADEIKEYVTFIHPDAPFNGDTVGGMDFQKDVLPSDHSYAENAYKRKYYQRKVRKMTEKQANWYLERSKLHYKMIQGKDGLKRVEVSDWLHIIPVEKYNAQEIKSRAEEAREIIEGKKQKDASIILLEQQMQEVSAMNSKLADFIEQSTSNSKKK